MPTPAHGKSEATTGMRKRVTAKKTNDITTQSKTQPAVRPLSGVGLDSTNPLTASSRTTRYSRLSKTSRDARCQSGTRPDG
jgi:hypothetical protein